MRFRIFEWDSRNIDHVARHGVAPSDAEAACRGGVVFRGRRGRYLAYGRTGAGRYLLVVVAHHGQGIARVITARDMTDRERQLYLRRH